MDGWQFTFTLPAAYKDIEVAELTERITDRLADSGHTWNDGKPEVALGRLSELDGTRPVYVNCTPDPTTHFASLDLITESKLRQKGRQTTATLESYLTLNNPSQAQTVAAIKQLISLQLGR